MPAADRPFDVDDSTDPEWSSNHPFKLVLRFTDRSYFDGFREAWIIYVEGALQCKWEMLFAAKSIGNDGALLATVFLTARSPFPYGAPAYASWINELVEGKGRVPGTGTGITHGSSSPSKTKTHKKKDAQAAAPYHEVETLTLKQLSLSGF
jgi:hypothetical protein